MGLILDSSVLIAAERQGLNARQILAAIAQLVGETEVALSVVTLMRGGFGSLWVAWHLLERHLLECSY